MMKPHLVSNTEVKHRTHSASVEMMVAKDEDEVGPTVRGPGGLS